MYICIVSYLDYTNHSCIVRENQRGKINRVVGIGEGKGKQERGGEIYSYLL